MHADPGETTHPLRLMHNALPNAPTFHCACDEHFAPGSNIVSTRKIFWRRDSTSLNRKIMTALSEPRSFQSAVFVGIGQEMPGKRARLGAADLPSMPCGVSHKTLRLASYVSVICHTDAALPYTGADIADAVPVAAPSIAQKDGPS